MFFLSDYGIADEFAGVVHAVLNRWAPSATVIDLCHQVPPFDVAAGSAMLERSVPSLGPGVVLAVVDPGVGTERRSVAISVVGRGPTWLVGPDNGLLLSAADRLGGVDTAFRLDRARLADAPDGVPTSAHTFDGRDVFAPAAAHLVMDGDPRTIGSEVDPGSLVVLDVAPYGSGGADQQEPRSTVVAFVTWIDRFGNVQLNLAPAALDSMGISSSGTALVSLVRRPSDPPVLARRVGAFAELHAGELGLLADANGFVALVLDQASAAALLVSEAEVEVGDEVLIAGHEDAPPPS